MHAQEKLGSRIITTGIILLYVPGHYRVANEPVRHEFNLTWLTVEQHSVAFSYLPPD